MEKFIKIIVIVIFLAISGLSNIANAQNVQAYSDATIDGRGFSYNVQLSITPIENNEVTHAGGWIVKLISVNPDSKGYYSKGKTNRYFSCSELGSICNPSKFDMVIVKVKYQCDNNAEKLIVFYDTDREERIVVRQQPNTKCSIELESVTVRNNADEPIYRKRINEIEYPQQNTPASNSNTPSTSTSNSVTQPDSTSEVNINAQTATTGNVSETKSNPDQIPDDYKGNPLNYNNNSTQKSDFEQGYERGQQISDAVTPLGNAMVDAWNRKVDRENAKYASAKAINDARIADYAAFQNNLNSKLSDPNYFNQNVIQKIPSLLNTNSPSWESILNSTELSLAFGKNSEYIISNYKPTGYTKSEIRKQMEESEIAEWGKFRLSAFNGFYTQVRYEYIYYLNGVKIHHKNTYAHTSKFIYNEKNVVIGIYLELNTQYSTQSVYYPANTIEEYYKDMLSKVGENYLLLDANTILLKDKLIIIKYEGIELYDLNLLNDQYIVDWPKNYKNSTKYNSLGVAFKKSSEKIIKEKSYAIYEVNEKGVIIGSLAKDGIAEKAGLQIDDIISNINEIPVTCPYILQLIVQGCTKGSKLNITYLRNGVEYKTMVDI